MKQDKGQDVGGISGSRADASSQQAVSTEGFDPGRIREMLADVDARFLEPLIKKAADNFYCQVLDYVDGYLLENLDYNMTSHIRMLERENQRMRTELWNVDLKLSRGQNTDETRCAAIDQLNNRLNRALTDLSATRSDSEGGRP